MCGVNRIREILAAGTSSETHYNSVDGSQEVMLQMEMKGPVQGTSAKKKQQDLITVERGGDEAINDDARISITNTGNSEIKVILCKDKFRFRCEKFGVKKEHIQVFMSAAKL